MDNEDINLLIEILNLKERQDLANLLEGSSSDISESGQYGTYVFSVISTFIIYSPLKKYYKLRQIKEDDRKLLLDSILEIHPPEAYDPEITSVEFRILRKPIVMESATVTQTVGKTIRVFLSYSNKDKTLAGRIKRYLEYFGLEVFLAHEDINPSEEWQKVIVHNLESTDIFVPIITKNFVDSKWTNQETGIAFSRGKLIIPLNTDDELPYGFISKYQALKLDIADIDNSCAGIIKAIHNNERLRNTLNSLIIKSLVNSHNFQEAIISSQMILELNAFSLGQIKEIIRGSIQNDQIHKSFMARDNLIPLIKKYKDSIDEELLREFKRKFSE